MANKIAMPLLGAGRLTAVPPIAADAEIAETAFEPIRLLKPLSPPMIPLVTATCTGESPASVGLRAPHLRLDKLALEFEVSSDEEYVSLRLVEGEQSFALGARAHNYLLLHLARARLADAAELHRDSTCGWVYQDEFMRDPTLSDQQINVYIFRARKQLVILGVTDGDRLIERRPQTRQLRIGVPRISIVHR